MTTGWAVKNVESKAELDSAVAQGGPAFAHFWASWCEPSKHMDEVFAQLAVDTPYAMFFRVEAEEQPEIAEFYGVTTVPFFLFFKDGVVVDKMEGANAPELANKVAKHAGAPIGNAPIPNAAPASLGLSAAPLVLEVAQQAHQQSNGNHAAEAKDPGPGLSESLKAEIQSLITSKPVMLFMKGNPEEPRCGFSRKVVDALKAEGVEFGTFDILSNDAVRQGLKVYANWPTYPQLYVKGELIGGSDIVLEMSKNGELKQVLADTLVADTNMLAAVNGAATDNGDSTLQSETPTVESDLNQRLKTLINSKPVLLFMKGTPEEPRCGFSRKVVAAMQETGVEFSTFNILADNEVREGLKVFSNWPTYPQLYVKGELIGGCDIIMEMHQSGELKQTFAENGLLQKPSLDDRLKQLINSSENILFMKGTKDEPRCGFSKKVVNALKETEVDFATFDILSDEEVRQGLKTFSNWPTYPQLYHKGELLGGCDIIMEMKASGELKGALTE